MATDQPVSDSLEVTLRIPGVWRRPEEFYDGLPSDCHCNERGLVLADGSEFEMHVVDADDQFPRIFASSCPRLPTEDERDRIDHYHVNICLTSRCGSVDAAKQIMQAAAAVLTAGGAGVFVDNSGIAHGATDWHALNDSADDGGVYWAFVSTVRGEGVLYSIGMHILGFRDAIVPATADEERDYRTIHSFLGFTAFSGAKIKDGDLVSDPSLPTLRAYAQPDDRTPREAPMHNPFGRWRLTPFDVLQN
jgi:hypothetical protein